MTAKSNLYTFIKYLIFLLLAVDAYQYFLSDFETSRHVFSEGISYTGFVESFAITIDVTSWLVLLLCFEVETAWLPGEKIEGWVAWLLHGIRLICYFFVFSSYYGYIAKYLMLAQGVPFPVSDPCSLVGSAYTWLQGLDDYVPITTELCHHLESSEVLQLQGTTILSDPRHLNEARFMALVDVLYATTWLVVIAILEADVYLKEHGRLKGWVLKVSEVSKVILYLILLGGAVFWGFKGQFLDFWDSFLWLAAFALIDLNVFGLTEGERQPLSP